MSVYMVTLMTFVITWVNGLGESEFFYEAEFAAMKDEKQALIMKAS